MTALKRLKSTPSGWRVTVLFADSDGLPVISIHTLRVEGDDIEMEEARQYIEISIHTLRVEGDFTKHDCSCKLFLFQSTPSGWRVTTMSYEEYNRMQISIHTLRVEGDGQSQRVLRLA